MFDKRGDDQRPFSAFQSYKAAHMHTSPNKNLTAPAYMYHIHAVLELRYDWGSVILGLRVFW